MGAGKNVLLSLVSFFLTISIALIITLLGANTLLHPQIYEKTFEENGIYDLFENSTEENNEFSEIPEKGIRIVINTLLDNILSYLRGDSNEPNLNLTIDNESLRGFFEDSIEGYSICGKNDEVTYDIENITCRPKNQTVSEFLDNVFEENNLTISEATTVDLKQAFNLEENNLERARFFINVYRWIFYVSLIFSILMTILTFFLAEKSIFSTFKWMGITLFFAGISVVISVIILNQMLEKIIMEMAQVDIFKGVSEGITSKFLGRINLYSYIITGFGILLFASSFAMPFVFKKKAEISEEAQPAETNLETQENL